MASYYPRKKPKESYLFILLLAAGFIFLFISYELAPWISTTSTSKFSASISGSGYLPPFDKWKIDLSLGEDIPIPEFPMYSADGNLDVDISRSNEFSYHHFCAGHQGLKTYSGKVYSIINGRVTTRTMSWCPIVERSRHSLCVGFYALTFLLVGIGINFRYGHLLTLHYPWFRTSRRYIISAASFIVSFLIGRAWNTYYLLTSAQLGNHELGSGLYCAILSSFFVVAGGVCALLPSRFKPVHRLP